MELTPQQVAEQLNSAQILDVRETPELADGVIPGSRHIPLGELAARHSELDKGTPVIAVCRSGRRSANAADELAAAGFTAHTMTGGMLEWQSAGLPIS